MKAAFAGSPPFATRILQALVASRHRVVALVTPPERPRGRGQKIERSPLVALAESGGIPIVRTDDANAPDVLEKLRALAPDVLAVASFGQLLRAPLLELAPHAALNVHASLLPRHRGASPIQHALLLGDAETGVSIQRMVLRLDAGPVCLRVATAIGEREDAGELSERLSDLGGRALVDALDLIESGKATFEPQDESLATRAPKLRKSDGRIDWTRPAIELDRFVRAMTPWPGAWAELAPPREGESGFPSRLRVLKARVRAKECPTIESHPGTIVALPPARELAVATGDGALLLERVQPEGGRAMGAAEFLRGHDLAPGASFAS